MKKYLSIEELKNSHWNLSLSKLSDFIISAFIFGECLEEGFSPLISPWKLHLIIKDEGIFQNENFLNIKELEKKENLTLGFLFKSTEIEKCQELFPLECLEIANRNVTLFGEIPFKNFSPEKEKLIVEIKRIYLGFLLNHRKNISKKISSKKTTEMKIQWIRELTPVLNGIYYLKFKTFPNSRTQIYENIPELDKRKLTLEDILKSINLILEI